MRRFMSLLHASASETLHFRLLTAMATALLAACHAMPMSDLTSAVRKAPTTVKCSSGLTTARSTNELLSELQVGHDRAPRSTVAAAVPGMLLSRGPQLAGSEVHDPSDRSDPTNLTSGIKPEDSAQLDSLRPRAFQPTGQTAEFQNTRANAVVRESYAQALQEAHVLSRAFAMPAVAARFSDIQSSVPTTMKQDKVFGTLFAAVRESATTAQNDAATSQSLAWSLEPGTTRTTPADADKLTNDDFKQFALVLRATLSSSPLALGGATTASPVATGTAQGEQITFRNLFVEYFSEYYHGDFVDRFGTKYAKPALSRNISNAEIVGAVQVLWELIYDYAFRTPVWIGADKNYYPGAFSTAPTAVTSNLIKAVSLLADEDSEQCGITKLKAEAIEYLANAASDKASSLGGLVGGSFGGLHFGLGVLGKLSIGDNQTLQSLVKASLGKTAERATEEASYRVLYWVPYKFSDKTVLADLVQQYLQNNTTSSN